MNFKPIEIVHECCGKCKAQAEPVGSIHKAHLKPQQEPWCKEILLYSPNNTGDSPGHRVTIFTYPPDAAAENEALKADIQALEAYIENTRYDLMEEE